MTEQALREFEEKLDEILDWYDDDGKERFLRYVLGHVIPRQKARHQALATTEPVVNQQLTTEPFDERYRFEYEMRKRCNWSPNQFSRSPFQHDEYAEQASQDAWEAWQARAAMAQGVK